MAIYNPRVKQLKDFVYGVVCQNSMFFSLVQVVSMQLEFSSSGVNAAGV